MASKISINLDTSKESYILTKCKQDDDLTLEALIYENGLALDLSNKEIIIKALKADNTYINQSTGITKANNKMLADLIRDFSRVPGTTKIEILLVEGGKQNTTFSFYLEVVGSVVKGAVESSNTLTILEKLDNKVLEAGQVKAETELLIKNGGAATKGDIATVNSHLEHIEDKKINKLEQYKNIDISRLYRNVDNYTGGQGCYMQGGVYTKDNKVIYSLCDVVTPNTNIVELVEVDIETGQKVRSKTLDLGHCNSLTYNSERDILVSATLYKYVNSQKIYVNELIEIDYETLTVLKTVNLNTTENVSGVAYCKLTDNVYVMLDPFIIAVCNTLTYEIEKRINLYVPKRILNFTRQSFEIWNNHIYVCGYAQNYISVFDMNGNNTQNYRIPDFIDNMHKVGELEDITAIGDGKFLMFSVCNISTKFLVNMVSEFDLVKQVASGAPYGFTNPDGPQKIYVDINSTSINPDGSKSRPFKQLNEAILSVTSNLFNNVEIYLADGIYDWTYIGECRGKIYIVGNSIDNTQIKGLFLNSSDVDLSKAKINESDNTRYKGLINCYGATFTANNIKLNTLDYGIYSNGSVVNVRNLTELNESENIKTIYGINNSVISIQRTATNIVKAFVDNSSQLFPNILIYNNVTSGYLNDIPIPKWFEDIITNNSLKYLEFNCGIKVTNNNQSYNVIRTLLSGYSTITLSLSRVSGSKTYISTLNLEVVTIEDKRYFRPSSGYITTLDFSTTPTMTTKAMIGDEVGSIYIGRIFATN